MYEANHSQNGGISDKVVRTYFGPHIIVVFMIVIATSYFLLIRLHSAVLSRFQSPNTNFYLNSAFVIIN